MLGPLGSRFESFQWHSYEFPLPPGAVELARTEVCLQACRIGEVAWALQFHPEVTRTDALHWTADWESDPDAVAIGLDPTALAFEIEAKIDAFSDLGVTSVGAGWTWPRRGTSLPRACPAEQSELSRPSPNWRLPHSSALPRPPRPRSSSTAISRRGISKGGRRPASTTTKSGGPTAPPKRGGAAFPAPPSGRFAAETLVGEASAGTTFLYQDVALPGNSTNQLSLYLYYGSAEPIAVPTPDTLLDEEGVRSGDGGGFRRTVVEVERDWLVDAGNAKAWSRTAVPAEASPDRVSAASGPILGRRGRPGPASAGCTSATFRVGRSWSGPPTERPRLEVAVHDDRGRGCRGSAEECGQTR